MYLLMCPLRYCLLCLLASEVTVTLTRSKVCVWWGHRLKLFVETLKIPTLRARVNRLGLTNTFDLVFSRIWAPFSSLVSHGHTPFCKRGKGSGIFFYSSLLPWHCGVRDQSQRSILSHVCCYHNFNRKFTKCKSIVKLQAAALPVFCR